MVITTLGFSLIPLLVLGVTMYYQFHTAYTSKVIEVLRTLVQNRRGSLELFLQERVAQLTTVARTHSIEQLCDENYLSQVFNTIQSGSKSYVDISVIDQHGNHVAYVGPFYEMLKKVNYGREDWFNAAMASGVYISDIFMGFRKVPHFIIAVTRVEPNRSWILRATINTEVIDGIVQAAQLGKRGDAFIVNRNNILQTSPRFSGKILEQPNTPDLSFRTGIQVEEVSIQGEESLVATSQITNPKWVLVVRESVSEGMAPLFRARFVELLVLIAGVALVVIGTVWSARAITAELARMERDKAEGDEVLMHSAKMAALGKMAAGVAHEINNPLQVITEKAGWMKDLLEEEDLSKSQNFQELNDCVLKIERQLDRCRNVTHRLLRFGRRMEPTQENVDVNRILAETITFLENEARFRDIRIDAQYDGTIPSITSDSSQLQQVFLNIIENAIDAIGKSGSITVKTSHESKIPNEVIVDISDTGPGMSKEILAKVFDPFFTTKGPSEGTGLGLSISHSIIEKLGGRIAVTSQPGVGTTFRICVPA
jgi:two-component system NtrC family sensor kinase